MSNSDVKKHIFLYNVIGKMTNEPHSDIGGSRTNMILIMRKPTFFICKNKDADQLHGNRNREADQRLCIRFLDISIPLLHKSEFSSLYPSSAVVQPGLCQTRSETLKTGFHMTKLSEYVIHSRQKRKKKPVFMLSS